MNPNKRIRKIKSEYDNDNTDCNSKSGASTQFNMPSNQGNIFDASLNNSQIDLKLMNVEFPRELEGAFATAIFELGLKNSSPKVIMPQMPAYSTLSTEHIKSHLQKYRIHHQRSKEEFYTFYKENFQDSFQEWIMKRSWESSMEISHENYPVKTNGNSSVHPNSNDDIKSNSDVQINQSEQSYVDIKNNYHHIEEKKLRKEISSSQEVLKQAESIINEWKTLCNEVLIENQKLNNGILYGGNMYNNVESANEVKKLLMAEARAARKAKILARENRSVAAVSGELADNGDVTEKTPKERPLASRRNLISSIAKSSSIEDSSKDQEDVTKDPDVDTIDVAIKKVAEYQNNTRDNDNCSSNSSSSSSKKEIVYTKKTLKEIEEEVAINTAKFDARTVSSTQPSEPTLKVESSSKSANPPETENTNIVKKEEIEVLKKKIIPKNPIQPANAMKLFRIFLIIALGSHIAFHNAPANYIRPNVTTITQEFNSQLLIQENSDGLPEVSMMELQDESNVDSQSYSENPRLTRTWMGYFQSILRGQMESVISGVSLIWWISNLMTPVITARIPKPATKKSDGNFLDAIVSLYQHGFDGILESFFGMIGEFSIYIFTLFVVTAILVWIRQPEIGMQWIHEHQHSLQINYEQFNAFVLKMYQLMVPNEQTNHNEM